MQFHTIFHELGYLFCYHQFYTESKRRKLTIKEREFEAETVAWLVCKRNRIYNPSEEYLASYAPLGEIPICSTDLIMKAVAEIERMMESPIKIKESLWYKEDKGLKEKIRVIERQQKGPDLFAYPSKISAMISPPQPHNSIITISFEIIWTQNCI